MSLNQLFAWALFAAFVSYLLKKKLGSVIIWLLVTIFVARAGLKLSMPLSVLSGIAVVYAVSIVTAKTWEGFENEEESEEQTPKNPNPAPPKTNDPHVDVGTTILHAYRNLTPEQIGGMRKDTRELLELQKELMGSLSEMKPAIEQGAELLKTFSTFFGDGQQ